MDDGKRETTSGAGRGGLSRRRMLATMGAGTALAWSAPAITTLGSPAFATGSPPPGGFGTCPDAVLSGGQSPAETIGVDDDLSVYLNGSVVFSEDDDFAQETPPIHLGPVSPGDKVRVTANDSRIFGGHRQIEPLYLHCPSTGAVQVLDRDGFEDPNVNYPPSNDVFYDRTFTVS